MNRSALRAVPLAVGVAVVAVLAAGKWSRRAVHTRATSNVVGAPSAREAGDGGDPASALSTPLRGVPRSASPGAMESRAPRMVHGDVRHSHRVGTRGPKAADARFRVDVGGPVASQVVASPDEQTLYVSTLAGDVVALARADGAKRWSVALGDRVYSTPLVADDGTLYVGTDAKKLVAISSQGAVLWRLELDGEVDTSPVLAKDGTIIVGAGSRVVSVRRGGDVAWRFAAKGKVYSSPAIAESGLVVFGSQDDHVYALTPAGALAWAVDLGADVDASPVVDDDGTIFIGTDAGDLVKLDRQGHVLWRTPVGGFVRGVLSLGWNGDVLAGTYGPVPRVVRVAPDGTIRGAFAIRGTGAKEFGIHGGPLSDVDGAMYFGAQDDAVYALEPSGTVRWRFASGGDVDGPLTILSDGSLVFGAEDGRVTLLSP